MRKFIVVGLAAFALVAAACGNDDDSGGDTSSSSTSGGDEGSPVIETFDVPDSADCSGGATGTANVEWTTTNATEVILFVDDEQVASGPDPSGSDPVDVPCDGDTHSIGIEAENDAGDKVSDAKDVTTEATGGGSTTTAAASTTTGGGGSEPACTEAAMEAALKAAGQGPVGGPVRSIDSFECDSGWAYAIASIGLPVGADVNFLLKASGSNWVVDVNKSDCSDASVPAEIKQNACDVN